MAAAAGGWAALILSRVHKKFWDADSMMNGVLAGLVGITAGCSTLEPWAAALTGFIGGIIYYGWCALLRKIRVDDVLGASAVHGAAGVWGVVAVGLFATPGNMAAAYADTGVHGLFYGGGGEQLGVQFLGCFAIIAWVSVTSGIMFGVMKVAGILRVSEAEEIMGLDEAEHGGAGYVFDSAGGSSVHQVLQAPLP